jgi:hypothetical protein
MEIRPTCRQRTRIQGSPTGISGLQREHRRRMEIRRLRTMVAIQYRPRVIRHSPWDNMDNIIKPKDMSGFSGIARRSDVNTRIWIIMIAVAAVIGGAFAGSAPPAPIAPTAAPARPAPIAPINLAPPAPIAPIAPINLAPSAPVAPIAPIAPSPLAPVAALPPQSANSAAAVANAAYNIMYPPNVLIITNGYPTNGVRFAFRTNVVNGVTNPASTGTTNGPVRIFLPVGQPLVNTSAPPVQ